MFPEKLKFPKRRVVKTALRTPAPGLKPLLLVDRLVLAQAPTPAPKKKCGNPATRLFRVLGLKKEKVQLDIPKDYVVVSVATGAASSQASSCSFSEPGVPKPLFRVPLRYDPLPLRLPTRPVSKTVPSPRPPRISRRPSFVPPRLEAPDTPRPRSAPFVRAPLVSSAGSTRPARRYFEAPAISATTSSSGTAPPGLKPLLLRATPAAITTPPPPPPPSAVPPSTTPTPTVKKQSRIPRYVGNPRSSRPSRECCVLCGSPQSPSARSLSTSTAHASASSGFGPVPHNKGDESPSKRTSECGMQTDAEVPARTISEERAMENTSKRPVDVAVENDPGTHSSRVEDEASSRASTAEMGIQVDFVEPVDMLRESRKATVDAGSQTEPQQPASSTTVTAASIPSSPAVTAPPPPPPPPPSPTALRALVAAFKAKQNKPAATAATLPASSWSRVKRDSSGLLDELKDRLARRNTHATTPSSPPNPGQSSSPAASKFSLRSRRPVQKENVETEEGELQQVFRNRQSARAPLGQADKNVVGAKSDDRPTFGARKIRRIVVPPVEAGSVPSRDPRIQDELGRLRAQAKVGGGGGAIKGAGAGASRTN